ncbi:MAG: DUF5060 domain-containing protein [Kiritimatiellae bacterium]|nr:DUF5060 domain-containing protein [Kiritimatiellia bacterium]
MREDVTTTALLMTVFMLALPMTAEPEVELALKLRPEPQTETVTLPYETILSYPGEQNFHLDAPHLTNWLNSSVVRMEIIWPDDAPEADTLFWLKDRNDFWHQRISPAKLKPGLTNMVEVPFQPDATGWQTPGHSLAWNHRVRINPQSVGFRIFSDAAFTGKCVLVSATLTSAAPHTPPVISKIRQLTRSPRTLSLFEASFDLPDRYNNPFDPGQIDASARIVTPEGTTNTIHAFYYQPHYRLKDELGEPVEPDGQPEWRLRYCPRSTGEYNVTLYAKDTLGECVITNALRFTAAPADADALKFVKVSVKDPRYFEFCDGSLFYPIGHNTRSATDDRMDDKFPWVFRKTEGSTAYRRYFKRMQDAGENMAEVWMSAWSLGLEWTAGVAGYHGANDYHMGNAWELDRVVDLAMRHGIYLNLVLNYHGRISTWCDPEWHLHPYNKKTPGGWLDMPLEFFSDPLAIEMQKRFCRYTHARWGWAPVIFGYELCSEINLTGHESHHKTHFEPAVVEWCRTLGSYLKEIDHYGHLVSAHVSNDYKFLNPAICGMPEMDFNPLDAYHHGQPERIIGLVTETAAAGLAYNKPILITEFGGSPMAAGLEHLMLEQHAAIWTGACVPISGIPMFWWWQVVDEHDLYRRYTAIRNFMEGVDPRDISAKQADAVLTADERADKNILKKFAVVCTASPEKARGYIHPVRFARAGEQAPVAEHLTVEIGGVIPGLFRVEFYETKTGKVVRRFDARSREDRLPIPVPKFTSDCAFKINLLTPVSKR